MFSTALRREFTHDALPRLDTSMVPSQAPNYFAAVVVGDAKDRFRQKVKCNLSSDAKKAWQISKTNAPRFRVLPRIAGVRDSRTLDGADEDQMCRC